MTARRRIETIGAVVVATTAAAAIYTVWVVRSASVQTPTIVAAALDAAPLQLSDLTPRQREILIRVQDPAFYQHRGVDWSTPGAGLTTITQADVKLLYFPEGFEPGLAKIRQTLIAWLIVDSSVSKDDQLRIFINHAYLGNLDGQQVRGFEDAARAYFGVPFSKLTEDQYINIVAMLVAPKSLNARTEAANNAERSRRIRRLIDGRCQPTGLRDTALDGCA